MFELELRAQPSRAMAVLAPLVALAATVVFCALLFSALGKDPLRGLQVFFVEPLSSVRGLGELALKATPLLLMGLGLCVCFRANVWNIGAEGQFILGAICAGGVALCASEQTSAAIVPLLLVSGVLGGVAWAGLTAWLRDRFSASEILVSLMLVYVAEQVLSYLVFGPWRDPLGYNFPQTQVFASSTSLPRLVAGSRANVGLLIALALVGVFSALLYRTRLGHELVVGGASPSAARYAGFSPRKAVWTACCISGATAGLAGALEVAGPLGQLTPHVSSGYGFAAIIVAFVGRLDPLGVVFASVLTSLFYIGGELAQSRLGLPKSLTLVFQGSLLFVLLATDTLIRQRVKWVRR